MFALMSKYETNKHNIVIEFVLDGIISYSSIKY